MTYKNFAVRGSVLRNTSFIIGIVLYVGSETKAHLNSQAHQRKQSWTLSRMHKLVLWLFIVIGVCVLFLSIGGLLFEVQNDSWPDNLYKVSSIGFDLNVNHVFVLD